MKAGRQTDGWVTKARHVCTFSGADCNATWKWIKPLG